MELFFRLGSWLLVLTALLHQVVFFPVNPFAAQATDADSMFDALSLSFVILTLFVGLANLVLMRVHRGRIKGLRIQALLSALLAFAMFLLSWIYFIVPPLICFGLCLLFFGLAFVAGGYQSDWEKSASSLA